MQEEEINQLLDEITEQLENIGDLPIFSSTVNRVHLVGSDPESDAMALATEILKDANLTTKVLKLANSSYYNRGAVKVGALTRAVVMLGFDTVKSTVLTMKLIDSFQNDQPGVDISNMLVSAYMSAGFSKQLANEIGYKDLEQTYVCSLLHNVGEIITAYTLPEKYIEIQNLIVQKKMKPIDAQRKVLGIAMRKIGQEIVQQWEFPEMVSYSMSAHIKRKSKSAIKDKRDLNRAIASLSSQLMDSLYSEHPTTTMDFAELRQELSKVTGANKDVIANCLDKSFKQSCDLAQDYGLDKEKLFPVTRSDDKDRDRIAIVKLLSKNTKLSTNLDNYNAEEDDELFDDGYEEEPVEVSEGNNEIQGKKISGEVGGDSNVLLGILHELTTMMTQHAHINTVFHKVLEGLHRGVGFDRAMLCLISPDHRFYSGRMVLGPSSETLKRYFTNRPVKRKEDIISELILDGGELLVADIDSFEQKNRLPPQFVEKLNIKSFLVASLRVGEKPVGLFFADKHNRQLPITVDDNRSFMQLVAQAQLALQVR